MREFTDALGLPAKGEVDTDKLVGKKMKVKVNAGSYEGEYRARLQRFLPLGDGEDAASGGEDDYSTWDLSDLKEEIESREIEIEGNKTKAKLVKALVADDAGSNGATAAANGGEDYSEWSLDELKEEAEKRGILGNVAGRKTEAKLISALEADDEGPGSGDAAAADEPEGEDDYDEWELEDLLAEVKDRELTISGRKTKEKAIENLRADDAKPFN